MLRAQGYTPAIIYVEAGVNISKHMAVRLTPTALAVPASPEAETRAVGFAMKDAIEGEFLPVQTDGVIYDWSGTANLVPGREYYQAPNGDISVASAYDNAWPVGVAVNQTTFQIRIGSGGMSASGSSFDVFNEYIYFTSDDVANKYIDLAIPFYDPNECLFVILGGGSLLLLPDIDYVLTKSDPDSYIYDRVSWVGLSDSILNRALPEDMITLTKKGLKTIEAEVPVIFLNDGLVISEVEAKVAMLEGNMQVGALSTLQIKILS